METESKLSTWLKIVLVLLALPLLASSRIVSNDEECPPWFFYNTATNHCQCYHGHHLEEDIHCNEDGILLKVGNCMTYKRNVGTFFARCYYFQLPYSNTTADGYFHLPSNVSELNDYMCGHNMNRKGLVCSECIDGFGPSVTSFGYKCANCSEPWSGVALYILVEFVPITIFYLLILTFRISMTSAPMTCFILYSQLMVYVIFKDPVTISTLITQSHYSSVVYFVIIVGTFYGIWNLDLLKYIVPPFCISHKLSIIHIEFLNCVSAFYPLILVFLTWICVELHSQNFRPLVVLWKPFHRCFVRLRKEYYDTKHDVVDVFATILLLTYSKLNYQLVQILSSQYIILNGVAHTKVNLYDPTIVYMSNKHLPYVTVSLLILIILVIPPPFILLLYPTKTFSRVLTKLKVTGRYTIALETFVEKFYGCYTNGLNGTKDTRSFSAIFFILRPAVVLIYEIRALHLFYHTLILAIALFVGVSLLIAYVKPYRKSYMNLLDTLLLLHIALLCLLVASSFKRSTVFIAICEILLFTIPMIIFLLIFVAKFVMRIKYFLCSNNCVYHRHQCITESEAFIEDILNNSSEESKPLLRSASVNINCTSYT